MATKKKTKKVTRKATKKMVRRATVKKSKKTTTKVVKKGAKKTVKKTAKKVTKKTPKKSVTKKKVLASDAGIQEVSTMIGQTIPSFSLPATGGSDLSLEQLRGRKIVLYFYPKDDTPGCTLEGQDFTRLKSEFEAAGCEVLGVSRDSVGSHEKFCDKFGFTFKLLSDADEKLCNAFGVIKDKNMYGKMVRGIERSTFVIDTEGVVRREWRKVSVQGHAEEVLEAVRSI